MFAKQFAGQSFAVFKKELTEILLQTLEPITQESQQPFDDISILSSFLLRERQRKPLLLKKDMSKS